MLVAEDRTNGEVRVSEEPCGTVMESAATLRLTVRALLIVPTARRPTALVPLIEIVTVLAGSPSEASEPMVSIPAWISTVLPAPPKVLVPLRTSVPVPVLIRPTFKSPSSSAPPTVRVLAETASVGISRSVTAPAPRSRDCVPVKVKPWNHCIGFPVVSARAAPEVLLRVTPLETLKTPVPSAEALPKLSVPAVRLMPPLPVLAPESVSAPAPALVIGPAKLTEPERVSEEAPTPVTVHVWAPVATTGAEILTAPPLSWTRMPFVELPGAMVSVPPVPGRILKAKTPAGTAVKVRLSADWLPSSVRLKAEPVTLFALKKIESVACGRAPRSVVPEISVAQLVAPPTLADQEALVPPL